MKLKYVLRGTGEDQFTQGIAERDAFVNMLIWNPGGFLDN
jgi:hypothetical protein